jgi:hypothetical protein
MPAPASVLFSEMLTFVSTFSLCYLLDITEKNKNEILRCFMLCKASTVSITKVCFELAWALILVKACSLHIWTHNFHSDHWLFSHRSTVPPEG